VSALFSKLQATDQSTGSDLRNAPDKLRTLHITINSTMSVSQPGSELFLRGARIELINFSESKYIFFFLGGGGGIVPKTDIIVVTARKIYK
jgi:hypothetical protein